MSIYVPPQKQNETQASVAEEVSSEQAPSKEHHPIRWILSFLDKVVLILGAAAVAVIISFPPQAQYVLLTTTGHPIKASVRGVRNWMDTDYERMASYIVGAVIVTGLCWFSVRLSNKTGNGQV